MKEYKHIAKIIIITILIETFIFNFSFFKNLFIKPVSNQYGICEGLKLNRDGTYTIENVSKACVYYTNLNKEIKTIHVDIENASRKDEVFDITVFATDEANSEPFKMPEFHINTKTKRSTYQNLHLSGKSNGIDVYFSGTVGTKLKINDISLNAKTPFMFSFIRCLLIFAVIAFFYLFRPTSSLYKKKLLDEDSYFYVITLMLIMVSICIFGVNINPLFKTRTLDTSLEYQKLTEAFYKGQVYIDETPSDALKSLDNPYDYAARRKAHFITSEGFLWDYAYYKGKYYVYFGALPVVLIYLPYYAITGTHIDNYVVAFILSLLSIISIGYLLYVICKKWFKDMNLGLYMLTFILMFFSAGTVFAAKRPDLYTIPIIMGIFLATLGVALIIDASDSKRFKKTKLAIGSTLMASVVLSRPQFLIATILFLPLYYDYFFKDKKEFKKGRYKEFLAIIIPYLIIASITMSYNYARFGSPFDFGANYNLTTNDMTHRGFVFARWPIGILYYLFMPCNMTITFPYVEGMKLVSNYIGYTTYESMFGGFIFTHIITIITLIFYKFKKLFKDIKLYKIVRALVISSLVVILVDTQMSGILPRYHLDYAWMLILATIILIYVIYNAIKIPKYKKLFIKVCTILIFMSVLYEFFGMFYDATASLRSSSPAKFYYFYYLFKIF